ncbi:MAG: adenylosuccinate synthetase [Vulcanimicrobiota bacterium]
MRAVIVADLGFGDSGKGTMTDYLVRSLEAGLVVRFNGGAQAGHTVVDPGGRKHTFSQFGAGSLVPGVRTHLSRFMVVHPGGLLREAEILGGDCLSRLTVAPEALVITPFHQAANRIREIRRGADRHGSCGLGVGETVADSLAFPEDTIRFKDLGSATALRRKLLRVQSRKWSELGSDPVLESADVIDDWIALVGAMRVALAEDSFRETVVFEGAQGVLLDEWRGFHPYTTWSTCTFDNALELLSDYPGEVSRLGVLRSYHTRHGAGPLPTEEPGLALEEPDNHFGPWQGAFRNGWADAVLGRYAIACCGGVDGLAITHLDRVRPDWKLCTDYARGVPRPGPFRDLEYQELLTALLQSSQPRYVPFELERYEAELAAPIWYESWGPTWLDKRARVLAPKEAVVAPTA